VSQEVGQADCVVDVRSDVCVQQDLDWSISARRFQIPPLVLSGECGIPSLSGSYCKACDVDATLARRTAERKVARHFRNRNETALSAAGSVYSDAGPALVAEGIHASLIASLIILIPLSISSAVTVSGGRKRSEASPHGRMMRPLVRHFF
jgi:hypothetical protein